MTVALSSGQRQYLLIAHCIILFAINFVLNGAIGLISFRSVDPVPAWGIESSAGPDLIGTCFFLPAITCLIVTPLIRRHRRSGTVEGVTRNEDLPAWLRLFRRPLATRALLFGAGSLVFFGGMVALGLLAAAAAQFDLTPFLWFKASFSGLLGSAVTPIIALVALAEGACDEEERPNNSPRESRG